MALIDKLTAIGDAIRGKTGKTDLIKLDDMPNEIASITTGGGGHELEDGLVSRTVTEYINDRVTEIGNYVFANNSTIQKVSCANVEVVGASAFNTATALVEVNLPKAKIFTATPFIKCTSLRSIALPNCSSIPAFKGCTKLEKADFGSSELTEKPYITANVFQDTAISTIILRCNAVFPLPSVDTFNKTPFAVGGTGGVVYVPQARIEQYQTATNWSVLFEAGTCTFLPIEGSEYE
jgi:hypothetical protein